MALAPSAGPALQQDLEWSVVDHRNTHRGAEGAWLHERSHSGLARWLPRRRSAPPHPLRRAPANLDPGRLQETVAALRSATDLVVQLSTGGSVHGPLAGRLRTLDAEPDSCSLTTGTTNFGDDVFLKPWPFVQDLYRLSQERHVVPEFE